MNITSSSSSISSIWGPHRSSRRRCRPWPSSCSPPASGRTSRTPAASRTSKLVKSCQISSVITRGVSREIFPFFRRCLVTSHNMSWCLNVAEQDRTIKIMDVYLWSATRPLEHILDSEFLVWELGVRHLGLPRHIPCIIDHYISSIMYDMPYVMCECTNVRMYGCMNVCVYECMHAWMHVHRHHECHALQAYICVYIYIYTYIHVYICVYIYMHTYTYTYVHTHTHVYTYMHICICTYMNTYIYIYVCLLSCMCLFSCCLISKLVSCLLKSCWHCLFIWFIWLYQ